MRPLLPRIGREFFGFTFRQTEHQGPGICIGRLGRGGLLTIDWIPARGNSFNVGVKLPINQPWRGKTRPTTISVKMKQVRPAPPPYDNPSPALLEALDNVEAAYDHVALSIAAFPDHDFPEEWAAAIVRGGAGVLAETGW